MHQDHKKSKSMLFIVVLSLDNNVRITYITVSDSCSNGTATDTSGPHLVSLVKEKLDATDVNYLVVPDEADVIQVIFSIASALMA